VCDDDILVLAREQVRHNRAPDVPIDGRLVIATFDRNNIAITSTDLEAARPLVTVGSVAPSP